MTAAEMTVEIGMVGAMTDVTAEETTETAAMTGPETTATAVTTARNALPRIRSQHPPQLQPAKP